MTLFTGCMGEDEGVREAMKYEDEETYGTVQCHIASIGSTDKVGYSLGMF